LVGAGEVEGEIEVLDEEDDGGSGVGSADADVEGAAADAQSDLAPGVDHVASDAVVERAASWERPSRMTAVMTSRALDT
jgi:hypothetical protein